MKRPAAINILSLIAILALPARAQDEHILEAQAQKAIADTFSTMSGSLMKALGEGGVEQAVPFCHENVKELAANLQKEHGVRVQRVTHKPRNPANQASESELKMIESIQEELAKGEAPKPVLTRNEKGTRVYYAPILIPMETCLKCHGQPETDIAPADVALIHTLYPQDQATGFKVGDLRGLWKITFEDPTTKQP